jgi:hypothetical protein
MITQPTERYSIDGQKQCFIFFVEGANMETGDLTGTKMTSIGCSLEDHERILEEIKAKHVFCYTIYGKIIERPIGK